MDSLIGLIAIGSLIWAVVILFRRVSGTTTEEKVVLSVASLCLVLYIIGSMSM